MLRRLGPALLHRMSPSASNLTPQLGLRLDRSCRENNQKGTEVSTGTLYQGDSRPVCDTADRASSMEFPNLRSCGIGRLHESHGLAATRREEGKAFSAL